MKSAKIEKIGTDRLYKINKNFTEVFIKFMSENESTVSLHEDLINGYENLIKKDVKSTGKNQLITMLAAALASQGFILFLLTQIKIEHEGEWIDVDEKKLLEGILKLSIKEVITH